MGVLFAFFSALAFSFSNVMIKKGQQESGENNGFFITIGMNAGILLVLFFIILFFRDFTIQLSWVAVFWFLLAGLCTTGFGRYALFSGIRRIGPSRASAIKNCAPIFTVSFALLFLEEQISFYGLIGIMLLVSAVAIQGSVLFFTIKSETDKVVELEGSFVRKSDEKINRVHNMRAFFWIGYFLVILSAFGFGVGQGFRKLGMLYMDDAFFGAMTGSVAVFLFFLIYEFIKGDFKTTWRYHMMTINRYFIGSGIFSSLGPLLFFLAVTHAQVSYVSVIAGIEPFLTLFLSILILKKEEKITISLLITVLMVVVGTTVIGLAG